MLLLHLQGIKKTKLGLREFVRLGEFVQQIDTDQQLAVRGVSWQGGLRVHRTLSSVQRCGSSARMPSH